MDTRTNRTNALVPVRHIRIAQHLALSLQGAIYAVALPNVREFIEYITPTSAVPMMPDARSG